MLRPLEDRVEHIHALERSRVAKRAHGEADEVAEAGDDGKRERRDQGGEAGGPGIAAAASGGGVDGGDGGDGGGCDGHARGWPLAAEAGTQAEGSQAEGVELKQQKSDWKGSHY